MCSRHFATWVGSEVDVSMTAPSAHAAPDSPRDCNFWIKELQVVETPATRLLSLGHHIGVRIPGGQPHLFTYLVNGFGGVP
jgi:hypothetical protein